MSSADITSAKDTTSGKEGFEWLGKIKEKVPGRSYYDHCVR